MTNPDLGAAPLSQIAIRAVDVDRAAAFYKDKLGLQFLFQFPGLAFFQSGQVRLMLSKAESAESDHPASVMYFKVSNVEQTHATLSGRGVSFVDQPHIVHRAPNYHLWMCFFKDTEGNTIGLMEERPV